MSFIHTLLALLVVVIWGVNFIFVKLSLDEFSPLLLCTLRFLLASVPAIFFIKPPKLPFKFIVLYGVVTFALQFSFLFLGMHVGMTPGIASLIMQMQVFFSLFFAAVILDETPGVGQIIGALVSFSGIGLVALHLGEDISLLGFIFISLAAASFGAGNFITKKFTNVSMISLVVWGCFVACLPMLVLSLVFEGPASIVHSYTHVTWKGAVSLLYVVYISTWVGYGVWNWLLSRYPVGTIVPFTLFIPIIGMVSSILMLGEPMYPWKLVSGLLVIGGLYINLLSSRYVRKKASLQHKNQ